MKIAYVYDAVYPWVKGGAEKRIYEIAKRLVEREHEVHWFGLKWWEGESDTVNEGIHLHGIGKWDNLYVNGRRSIKGGLYFGFKTLTGLKGDFDVIDCQEFPYFSCFAAKIHSMLKRIPLVITWYEFWGNYWYEYLGRKGVFGKIVEKLTLRLPRLIVANSDKIKQDLVCIGIKEDMIRVSPNGVSFQEIQEIKPSDKTYDILYAGRLVEHKHLDVLIKAVNIIKEEIPDITCGIIGDGPERDRLLKLSQSLNLDGHIEFLGFLEKGEDVISYMKSSKIFVLPSTREGSPITIVEANACGLPVITVNHKNNGATSLVEEGKNGFICELLEDAFAARIISLLSEKENLIQIRTSSKQKAKLYDWDLIVEKLEKIYESLI
jgi:glycosyltransferase involved in cell wall biosynthesis